MSAFKFLIAKALSQPLLVKFGLFLEKETETGMFFLDSNMQVLNHSKRYTAVVVRLTDNSRVYSAYVSAVNVCESDTE